MALMLLGVSLLTPAAAADGSSRHTVCLMDSQNLDRAEGVGSGCATGMVNTQVNCFDSGDDYHCNLIGDLGVKVDGAKTCGLSSHEWFDEDAVACVGLAETVQGDDEDWVEDDLLQTFSDIPSEGMTVVLTVETCVWADHTDVSDAAVYCEKWTHEEFIPGDPSASGSTTEMVLDIATGLADYAVTTAEHAEPPVGASP